YDESLAIFRRSNAETQALLNIAFVQSQRGDFTTAQATYQQVLSTEPTNRIATRALQILVAELEKNPDVTLAAGPPVPAAETPTAAPPLLATFDEPVPEVPIQPAEEFPVVTYAPPVPAAPPATIETDGSVL